MEEVPFLEGPMREIQKLREEHWLEKFAGEHAKGLVVPPDVERAAKAFDPAEEGGFARGIRRFTGLKPGKVKREAVRPWESVGAALPGVRKKLPLKEKAGKSYQ